MDEPDNELAPTWRVRVIRWRLLSRAGPEETSEEWRTRLLDSGLLVEGARHAADSELRAGDPRRGIAGIHRLMAELLEKEKQHRVLSRPSPWNTGAVRMSGSGIACLLGMVYMTGLQNHGVIGTASMVCLVAALAMWGDWVWRRRLAAAHWVRRNQTRDRLQASVVRLCTRSWVAPLGGAVLENTPHLDLLVMWRSVVRQRLIPWEDRLKSLEPLEDMEGLPEILLAEVQARDEADEVGEAEARRQVAELNALLARLEGLREEVTSALETGRQLAAEGTLPPDQGLVFDFSEVERWLREAGLEPDPEISRERDWLMRGP